jgi:hypothetical protein
MMRSILTIVWSLANSSGDGMPPSRASTSWRRSWRRWSDSALRFWVPRNVSVCCKWVPIWRRPGIIRLRPPSPIRAVLREVVAYAEDDQIRLLLHWQGGDHTHLTVRKNRRGQTRWAVEPETTDLIRACARLMPDKAIAGMLNRTGKRTGRLNGWTQSRVRGFRNTHSIAVYVDGRVRAWRNNVDRAAKMLDLSPLTVLRWIRAGIIPAEQYCKGAPWVIKRRDIEGHDLVERVKTARKGPSSSTPDQPTLNLSMM